jgi:hypothetical protein
VGVATHPTLCTLFVHITRTHPHTHTHARAHHSSRRRAHVHADIRREKYRLVSGVGGRSLTKSLSLLAMDSGDVRGSTSSRNSCRKARSLISSADTCACRRHMLRNSLNPMEEASLPPAMKCTCAAQTPRHPRRLEQATPHTMQRRGRHIRRRTRRVSSTRPQVKAAARSLQRSSSIPSTVGVTGGRGSYWCGCHL